MDGARVNVFPAINYYGLKSEVAITLHFQLSHYTVLQMKNSRRNASAINPATMKNMADLCTQTINY